MTSFQRVFKGLYILQSYLTPTAGEISVDDTDICIFGVHFDAIGGDDLATLQVLRWYWDKRQKCWRVGTSFTD